ncbi:UNVERIFIED_CONTAM: hypothetical protein NCL1_49012 [Trichonephila clavipes]
MIDFLFIRIRSSKYEQKNVNEKKNKSSTVGKLDTPPLSTDPASSSSQLTEPSNEEEEVKYLFSLEILLPTQYVEGDLFERVYVNCPLLSILRNDEPSSSGAPTEASNDEPSSYGAPTEASNDEVHILIN